MTDRPRAAVGLTLVALTVCACGGTEDVPDAGRPTGSQPLFPVPTAPGQTLEVLPPPPRVAWADDGRSLAVTTYGSSSCPVGPTDIEVVGAQEVRVELAFLFPDRDPCTADMAMNTYEVDAPGGISADEPLTVLLDHHEGEDEQLILSPTPG